MPVYSADSGPLGIQMLTPTDFQQLPAEVLAGQLLFFREAGFAVGALAVETGLPAKQIELLLCRGFATLLVRGHSPEFLCRSFTLTRAQLKRAATAPAFDDAFRPIGEWRWQTGALLEPRHKLMARRLDELSCIRRSEI